MTTTNVAPLPWIEPGVHRGIGERAYHALNLCSASRLRTLHRMTAAHLRHDLTVERDTPAMRIGTALHALVLEGEEVFGDRFAVGGPINERTGKPYGSETKAFAEWEQSIGKPVLSTWDASDVHSMASAIERHPGASALLSLCKERELTLIGDLHGQRCKARIDAYGDEGMIVDIKTTSRGAGRVEFERSIGTLGYGLQACLYESLAASLELKIGHFAFVVVESDAPHCVAVYRMKNEVMLLYEQLLPKLLEEYGACVATNNWPGWPDEVIEIGVPSWMRAGLEYEIEQGELGNG